MSRRPPLRQGQVYFVRDYPGLHGHGDKSRFVIVIHPPEKIGDERILVVPASTSTLSPFRVALPNTRDHPGTRSGFDKVSWAVCDQHGFVAREQLTDLRGYLSGVLINRIIESLKDALKHKKHQ